MMIRLLSAVLSLSASVLPDAAAQAPSPPTVAVAQATSFRPPKVGTRVSRALDAGKTDFVTVDTVEGMTVRTKSGTTYYAGFFLPAVRMEQFDLKEVESMWPLSVGRNIRFEAKNSRVQSSGPDSQFIVELEVIAQESMRIGQRDVPTLVIEQRVRNLTRGKIRIDSKLWFAPDYGVPVKYQWAQIEGRTYNTSGELIGPNGWTATRIQVPN